MHFRHVWPILAAMAVAATGCKDGKKTVQDLIDDTTEDVTNVTEAPAPSSATAKYVSQCQKIDCSIDYLRDDDGDGVPGYLDCDDNNAAVSPNQSEIYYDGVDNDCDPLTVDNDQDGDGFAASSVGGRDCDDENKARNPGAADMPNNGVDEDCSGADLTSSDAIHVATTGDDTTGDGSALNPYKTISKGINEANANNKKVVFIAGGLYQEDVNADVSLIGGFNNSFSSRDKAANPTKITGTTGYGVDVQSDADIELVDLDIKGRDGGAGITYGIYVRSGANVRMYGLMVSSGNTSSTGYGLYYSDAGIVTVDNSTIVASGQWAYVSRPNGVQFLTIRNSELRGEAHTGGGTCYGHYRGDGRIELHDNTIRCVGISGNKFSSWNLVYGRNGSLVATGNTLIAPGEQHATSSGDVMYWYQGNSIFADNAVRAEHLSRISDLMYGEYGRHLFLNNTMTCDGALGSSSTDLMYGYEANVDFIGNTIDCAHHASNIDVLSAEYGQYRYIDNTVTFKTVDGSLDAMDFEYGDVLAVGNDLSFGTVSSSTEAFYVSKALVNANGNTITIDRQEGSYEGLYIEYSHVNASDNTFTIGHQTTSYLYFIENQYGYLNAERNIFTIDLLEMNSTSYLINIYEAGLDAANNTFAAKSVTGTGPQSFYAAYIVHGGAYLNGNTYDVGPLSNVNEVYGYYNYYAGTRVDGDTLKTGAGADYAYASYNYEGSTEIRDSTLDFGGVAWTFYGVYFDEYGSLRFINSKLTLHDYADGVQLSQVYDGNLEVINSILVADAPVTSYAYGVYGDCCGSATIVHSYLNPGRGVGGTNLYGVYDSSGDTQWNLVNSIFELEPKDSSDYLSAIYLDSSGASVAAINNIFYANGIGWDDFVYSNEDGTLNSLSAAAACDWLECGQWLSNKDEDPKLTDPANGDFTPAADSPAIDNAGATWPYYIGPDANYDYNGKQRGAGAADIGPIER